MTVVVKSWKVILLCESVVTHGMAHQWLTRTRVQCFVKERLWKLTFTMIYFIYTYFTECSSYFIYIMYTTIFESNLKVILASPFSTFPLYSFFHMHTIHHWWFAEHYSKLFLDILPFIISTHLHFPFLNAQSLEVRQGINIFNATSSIHKLRKNKMTEIEKIGLLLYAFGFHCICLLH